METALRDRDRELRHLRQTMEHNEQVIFRVYQEKENAWERELRRIKAMGDNRLKTAAQKSLKLEQTLMVQTYKVSAIAASLGVLAVKTELAENTNLNGVDYQWLCFENG